MAGNLGADDRPPGAPGWAFDFRGPCPAAFQSSFGLQLPIEKP